MYIYHIWLRDICSALTFTHSMCLSGLLDSIYYSVRMPKCFQTCTYYSYPQWRLVCSLLTSLTRLILQNPRTGSSSRRHVFSFCLVWLKAIVVVVCTKWGPDPDFWPSLIDTILLRNRGYTTHKPKHGLLKLPPSLLVPLATHQCGLRVSSFHRWWCHGAKLCLIGWGMLRFQRRAEGHAHSEKRRRWWFCHFSITFFWTQK